MICFDCLLGDVESPALTGAVNVLTMARLSYISQKIVLLVVGHDVEMYLHIPLSLSLSLSLSICGV